jgi:4-hydroxy-tetrahydrodipicolinate synthase
MKSLRGTGAALVTPFDEKGKIDFIALEKLINHCIEGGLEYLVSMGTTGETPTLSKDEKKEILKFTKEKVAGRVTLIAGFGGNDTLAVAEELKGFDAVGYDYILSASPYYNKPSQEGIFQHYKYLASVSPLPIILYNVPGRTGSNMTAATTLRIANEVANIAAIKEASGNIDQMMQILKNRPANFAVLSGDDNLVPAQIAMGCDGVISVIANALPRKLSDMVRAALSNDFKTAAPEHLEMIDFIDLLFAEGNPVGVKSALKSLNICEDFCRLPVVPATALLREKLRAELIKMKAI